MQTADQVILELQEQANPEKATFLQRYFKTHEGGYGQGDQFIGVAVPHQRKTARRYYKSMVPGELETLLNSPIHEYRLTALFMLVLQFEKARSEREKERLVNVYLQHLSAVNNWDLVDSTAADLLGAYLWDKPRKLLYDFARSGHLWKQRIAIIATFYFIKKGQYEDTFAIAQILMQHPHDLIHKAVGWMLREVANRNFDVACIFLVQHYQDIPRTMLRYAIEKFPPAIRLQYLKGQI